MRSTLLSLIAVFGFSAAAAAMPAIGQPAPDFTAKNIKGEEVALSKLNGKVVVLEWNNPECPFVKKFYDSGEMQKLQAEMKAEGVEWITVNSSAEGKQGHLSAEQAAEYVANAKSNADHYVVDADGKIGNAYAAKTTPHMYVIDKDGKLAYMGAIDDKPTADSKDIAGARNYVRETVAAIAAGKPAEMASTQAYGCAVKYMN